MLQKIMLALLALTVIGAVGIGIYDAAHPAEPAAAAQDGIIAVEDVTLSAEDAPAVAPDAVVDTAAVVDTSAVAAVPAATPIALEQQNALAMVGDPWSGSGTVTSLDEVGVNLALSDGIAVYVELAPAAYQQQLGLSLAAGEVLTVDGFFNGEQIHAQTITLNNGTQYAFRSAEGQPLWSGGSNGNGNGAAGGEGVASAQVAAEDWLTMTGVITLLSNGNLTMQTADGTLLQTQIGQPRFWQDQGVTLTIGDAIDVLGFWEGEQFQAGEIRLTATGERIMLRDPNGRPLWGGPGRNATTGEASAASAANSTGQGGNGSSNGKGYRGGRSQ